MAEERRQAAGIGQQRIRLGIRGKLIVIFVLIKVIPLVVLALFAVGQIRDLGGTVQQKYEEMVGATRGIIGTVGGMAAESSIAALDIKSRENIERLTTDTARAVAAFLHERDRDTLLAARLPIDAESLPLFLPAGAARSSSIRRGTSTTRAMPGSRRTRPPTIPPRSPPTIPTTAKIFTTGGRSGRAGWISARSTMR